MKEIVMPQFGETSEDNIKIVKWLKRIGESIEIGDILVEVETDKAIMEVEAVERGILDQVLKQNDEDVRPGDVIGYIR